MNNISGRIMRLSGAPADGSAGLPPHGGYGGNIGAALDFSASINPLGMPEKARQAAILSAEDWEHYPDPYCTALRAQLAALHHTDPACIVCGNGADDLIYRIVFAVRPKKAIICIPTFGEYEKALRLAGSDIIYYTLRKEHYFDVREDLADCITPDIDMIFICNPNNPTGRLVSREFMAELSERAAQCGALIICDECFMDFVEEGASFSMAGSSYTNVITLRAFTKIFAMPGLRLGYAVCEDAALAEVIAGTGQYWSVSVPAQAAGIAALSEDGYIGRTRRYVTGEREYLEGAIRAFGIRTISSAANFILMYSDLPLYRKLLEKGILIRDCSDFLGLCHGWYRAAVRTHEENMRLIRALNEIIMISGQSDDSAFG